MEKFIDKVVSELIQAQTDFENTIIILPGNRPKLFFRKNFQNKLKNSLLPQFLSIDDFIISISGLRQVSQIQLWFQAYNSYKKITDSPDEFDVFLKWIPTLLNDFDDINSALVNPEEIFDYLVSAERIKKWGHENLEIGSNQLMANHLFFWKIAKDLYFQLNQDLTNKKLSYRGLNYKIAVEKLPEFIQSSNKKFVFAGLNALSNAERKIIFELQKSGIAELFWDSDSYYMQDSNQEAGYFLRQYKESSDDWKWESDSFSQPKKIQVTSIGKRVGQAKYLYEILNQIPENEYTETVVVLAEESLLPTVLSSIPEKIPKVNITMGFPLNKSSMAYFFRSVFELQMNREKLGKNNTYYYKNVLDVLGNTLFREKTNESNQLKNKIQTQNRIFTTPGYLIENLKESIYQPLFELPEDVLSFMKILMSWTNELMRDAEIEINELDKEYLYRFSLLLTQLKEEISEFQLVRDFKTLYILYNRLLHTETISFVGEPLEGIQIIGLLETRLLDFKNVIITSVNDGILPPGRVENSFIPFDIRRDMGMNTFTENDAVFAYHFYRLLQRSQSVQLLYNAEPDALGSGEKSRFISQMEIESGHQIKFQIAAPAFSAPQKKELVIEKTPAVMEALHNWTISGISPSSLSSYLRNPIEFYQQKVLKLSEFEEAEETVGARILGNIVHKSLEELYKDLLGKILLPHDILYLLKKMESVVERCFREEYKSGEFLSGKNFLIFKIAFAFVENVLKNDLKLSEENELVILDLEQKMEVDFELKNRKKIKLKGFIDRVDSLNGKKRIIDYKTGSVIDASLSVKSENIEKVFLEDKFAKPLQLLLYAHLFFGNYANQYVQFGIYPLKYPKKGLIPLKIDKETEFGNEILGLSSEFLSSLIEEILNPEIPFYEEREKHLEKI